MEISRLARDFFARPTLQVTRELLGTRLVRMEGGQRLAGYIVEAEAYIGETDLACHAKAGRTSRTKVMYSEPGHIYVYFTYGMHWMLNFVAEPADSPAAVLIRAIFPSEGVERMANRRSGQPPERWTDGPAKLCQALAIDGQMNGNDACDPDAELFVETGTAVLDSSVTLGPRVGLYTVPEPWKSMPWRFLIRNPKEIFADLQGSGKL